MPTHVSQEVLDHIVSELSKKFGNEDPLSVHTGDIHEYLGMTMDFSCKGKVTFRMTDYIENMLDELPDDFDGTAATSATPHLFKTRASAAKLRRNFRSCCTQMSPRYSTWPKELDLIFCALLPS
jgi:hypothetical protein